MNIKKMKLSVIIVAIGMILAVVGCLITCLIKEPVIKEQDFFKKHLQLAQKNDKIYCTVMVTKEVVSCLTLSLRRIA